MTPRRMTNLGWALFSLSGVLFLIPALQAGDPFVIVGCVIWLIAVGFFLMADRLESH